VNWASASVISARVGCTSSSNRPCSCSIVSALPAANKAASIMLIKPAELSWLMAKRPLFFILHPVFYCAHAKVQQIHFAQFQPIGFLLIPLTLKTLLLRQRALLLG